MWSKILCFFGIHEYDLKFFEGSLHTYEQCECCGKKRAGWLQ